MSNISINKHIFYREQVKKHTPLTKAIYFLKSITAPEYGDRTVHILLDIHYEDKILFS